MITESKEEEQEREERFRHMIQIKLLEFVARQRGIELSKEFNDRINKSKCKHKDWHLFLDPDPNYGQLYCCTRCHKIVTEKERLDESYQLVMSY